MINGRSVQIAANTVVIKYMSLRISNDILDMVPCICTYKILYLHTLVSRGVLHTGTCSYITHTYTYIYAMSNNQSVGVGYLLFNLNQL